METLTVGSVVITSFPFSNLKAHKNRPALVLGFSDFNDVVLCQITSIDDGDLRKVGLSLNSFKTGGLSVDSYIRPDKLFTADQSLITRNVGEIKTELLKEVRLILGEFFGI